MICKSFTVIPVLINPANKALCVILDTASASLLATTVTPAPKALPIDAPNLAANSGLISRLDNPVTREPVNNSLNHFSSCTSDLDKIAPFSTCFLGHNLILGNKVASSPIEQSSAINTFSLIVALLPIVVP